MLLSGNEGLLCDGSGPETAVAIETPLSALHPPDVAEQTCHNQLHFIVSTS